MDKEQLAIARLQDAARLSEHRYKKPLMVTYSGGKDSQVLVALAERAGINFEVVNSHTTADAPETVYFIREQFKAMEERGIKCSIVMPRYKDKPVSMWTLIPQKLMPPTRLVRYCCAVLKENTGRDRFIATGVRWAESTNRKKNRGTMEFSHRDKEKRIILMGDNDEKRQLFETCNLKGKMTVNPIVDWSDDDCGTTRTANTCLSIHCIANGRSVLAASAVLWPVGGADSVSLCAGLLTKKCTSRRLGECLMSEKKKVYRAIGRPAWTFFAGGWKMTTSAVS